jgi:radical SAM protein with 4Fe4S-binding SPASM domain
MMSGIKIFKYRDVLPQLFSTIVRRRLNFRFELIPYQANRLSVKKILNLFLAGFNQFFLPSRPVGYPVFAQIEPSNFCNLSCPLCLTTSETPSRPKSLLSFAHFEKLIDGIGDYLLLIILWNWGEPFLNSDLFQMIAYARSKGILTHCSTNGNVKLDESRVRGLIDSGLDTLIFGVDGATQETYSRYRKGGDLGRVWENIRTVVQAKKEMASPLPRLNLRFVVMRHNEQEIPTIKEMAKELEVDFLSFKTVDLPPAREEAFDDQYVPDNDRYRRYDYARGGYRRIKKPFVCMRPWKRIVMDASGEIIPCEYDYKNVHSFGNIQDDSVLSIWRGKKAMAFRNAFNLGWNDYYLCRDCTYKNRRSEDCTVEMIDLRSGHTSRDGNGL